MKFNNETLRTAVKKWLKDETKAEAKYGHISNWDVSNVTDMSNMFKEATSFNQPIGNWDVSKVTNMEGMFFFAKSFNHTLNDWDVSKVTNMGKMFWMAESFNQPIGDWNVSNVTKMNSMFYRSPSFNQPIGYWDVSKVSNMKTMFSWARSFNQPIGDWNVSKVTNMEYMFDFAESFNQPIGNWDVSKVTSMERMFSDAKAFNQPLNNWDVSNVIKMENMFSKAKAFNQDLSAWNLTEKTFHENGNLRMEIEVDVRGQKNGILKKYHENGQLQNKTYWTNNIQDDGEVITYHPDGSKARKITVLNGEINGEFFEWYQNGNIKTQGTYNNAICHKEKEFDENGVLLNFKSLKFNHGELELALKVWIDNPKTAETKYGHISNWDTTEVKNIADIYVKAQSLNIDVTNWSLSFEKNGLLFKKTNQKIFTAYHKNGKKRFEYIDTDLIINEGAYFYDDPKFIFDFNSNSKLSAYDENGIELKEFTVFLIPKKGDTMVVFKTDKSNLKGFEHFSDTEFLLSEISYRDAINLTGDDEIDLKKYPPIMLDGSHSQSLLDILKEWIPDKKFVIVYRWNRLHEDNCDYEDYLCQFEAGDISEHYSHKIDHTEEELAVLRHYDKIFITGKKSDSDEPGQEITKFPGSATRDFVGLHSPFDYDELRIFEEEVFNNLNVEIDNEMMDIEGQKFPIAKKLILDVDKYKKLKLSPSL